MELLTAIIKYCVHSKMHFQLKYKIGKFKVDILTGIYYYNVYPDISNFNGKLFRILLKMLVNT